MMPTYVQLVRITTVALVVIGFLLIVIFLTLWRMRKTPVVVGITVPGLDDQVNGLLNTIRQAADVSVVLSMIKQIQDMDEDALALLESYPASLRAAAWLHRINCLGADLQAAQQQLSDAHQGKGVYYAVRDRSAAIAQCQAHVNDLSAKLDWAIEFSRRPASTS
jgi:uncharacterized protein YoxC